MMGRSGRLGLRMFGDGMNEEIPKKEYSHFGGWRSVRPFSRAKDSLQSSDQGLQY